jgi:phosphopantothenoylcysteine decarboxylase / phosphopantothenate---cysteine ligase
MKKILLIATGSIAAYTIIDLVRQLEKNNHVVTLILTTSAEKFISKITLKSMTKAQILADDNFTDPMQHINLARENDLILVAPASANFIAKIACGFADSLSLSVILASNIPIFIAPAMNPQMYNNKITQANLANLSSRDMSIIGPNEGLVACGEYGYGKFSTTLEIIDKISNQSNDLLGKKAIITLGSTREAIDPVRYISNYSSGRQGYEIAKSLREHGCEVQIIAGYTDIHINDCIKAVNAEEMYNYSVDALPADIYISVAAICDYKPSNYSVEKIKKNNDDLTIELTKNIDVVSSIATHPKRPSLVIGFALESQNFLENAQEKLARKNLDYIISNKTSMMNDTMNDFHIISKNEDLSLSKSSKKELAISVTNIIKKHFLK